MPAIQDSVNMALFCDFENVALGVRETKYEKFDIRPVLERLLLKGSIVVKKAYCDWDRYKGFKAAMHEASFEMIEIPHVRQSGKNSADIRLVVDALDLCYTKSHVDTFVIISGDSDFSPLVSKLRENAKKVIGVGVKHSTSDLLVANCDEFIFYDDLVRELQREVSRRESRETKRASNEGKPHKHDNEGRKSHAIAIAVETFEALASERGESEKIFASVLKSAIKRRKPGFSEAQYGFRAFGNLLDEAQSRGLLGVGRDEKNGSFVFRVASAVTAESAEPAQPVVQKQPIEVQIPAIETEAPEPFSANEVAPETEAEAEVEARAAKPKASRRGGRRTTAKKAPADVPQASAELALPVETPPEAPPSEEKPVRAARKTASRSPRARKTAAKAEA
jgi:uncharacterized protein (TIGR00288 family)